MQADDRLRLFARAQERVPVVGVHRGQPEIHRVLGKAHRFEPARRVAPHVGGRDLRIGQPGELQWDDAIEVWSGPLLDVPVVPRAQAREAELGILAAREDRSREAGDQRGFGFHAG